MRYGFEWTPGLALVGAVLILLIVPSFALIGLVVVALAAVAALVVLAGALLAMPFLLVGGLHRRVAERRQSNAPNEARAVLHVAHSFADEQAALDPRWDRVQLIKDATEDPP